MEANFQAHIGASIRDFQRQLREVDRTIREAATGADVNIGANVTEFMREVTAVQALMTEVARNNANPEINAEIHSFLAEIAVVEARIATLTHGDNDVEIDADTGGFFRGAARVAARAREFARDRVLVKIRSAWTNYQQTMGQIATFSRNIGEVAGIMGRGGMMVLAPAAIPVIASAVGLIGNLGPMIGTLGGSAFALATSFGAAGLGMAGFAAVAIPSIGGVIEKANELNSIDEKLAKATTWKQKAKLYKEQAVILGSMTKAQAAAGEALNKFKASYAKLVKDMEKPVLSVFASALTGVNTVLQMARPMIESSTAAVQKLMDSFNQNLKADDVKGFFDFMRDYAGPALETVGKAIGNFMMGIGNMLSAFGPLSTETQNSFLKMSESFRNWSASLGENKKFQSFINYVSENMPKIRSIFGDAIKGIINTFAGFAPTSSEMMSSLQGMMEKFRKWSSDLGSNKGFQNFLDYIRESGPTVVTTIGNIVKFITNLGIAMAPIGSKILELVSSFTSWANEMMKNHPWLGKIAAGALVVVGALTALAPAVLLANSLFGGLAIGMMKAAGRIALSMVTAMGPVGWVIAGIAALALVIYANWDKISAWSKTAWAAVSTAVTTAVSTIMTWIQTKFPSVYTIIQAYMTMVQTVISTVWEYIKGTFTNVLTFLKALVTGDFQGMKDAVSAQLELMKSTISRIWDAVKSYFSTVLSTIWGVVKEKFASIVSSVKEKMQNAKNTMSEKWEEAKAAAARKLAEIVTSVIKFFGQVVTKVREKLAEAVRTVGEKVGEMPGKVLSFVGQMVSAGGDLIQGLIDGAVGMASSAISAITTIAGNMVDAALSYFKIKSPSRVFMEIGDFVGQGLVKGVLGTSKQVSSAGTKLASLLTKAMNDKATTRIQRAALASTKVYASKQISILQNIAKQRETIANKIKTASQKLNDALKVRNDFAKTVSDNAKAYASISNIDAKSGGDFAYQMKERLKAIQDFQANIKRLQKAGLNATTLQDLINAGVDGGGAKAATLAGSSAEIIKEINSTQSAINKASSALGNDAANQFYGLGVDAARGIVKGLESQAKALEVSANKISDTLVKAVKKRLNIHSPSRVFAELGKFVAMGIGVGIVDKTKFATQSVAGMASAMTGAFNPQMELANMRASATLDTSVSRRDMGVVRHAFAAEMDSITIDQPDIVVQIDGHEVARRTYRKTDEFIQRDKTMGNIGRGKR